MEGQHPPRKAPGLCSFRYGLAALVHLCNVVMMVQRTCLNLTMIAMVNGTRPQGSPNTSSEGTRGSVKDPVYNWNADIQGIILSANLYGMIVIQFPIGYLSGICSIKMISGSMLFLSSVLTLCIPPAAQVGEVLVIVCRVVQGIAQGASNTALRVLWVKWAPPLERSRLVSMSLSGLTLGLFIGPLLTGFICERLGWPTVFYIFGAFGCALSVFWFILFYDDPKDHPFISIREREYITSSLEQQVSSKTHSVPIKAMLKSLPVWAITLNSFAFIWTNNLLSVYTPTFVHRVLHVNIRENGLLSSLPYLFAYMFGILSGHMADFLLSRNVLSLIATRKLFTTLGILSPVVFSMCLLYLSFDYYSIVIFLTLTSATTNFILCGIFVNILDIAPRYCGFLHAASSVFGNVGGLISLTVTGFILSQDLESPWTRVFGLMAAVNVTCVAFFLIFAKAEIQDWAKDAQETRL